MLSFKVKQLIFNEVTLAIIYFFPVLDDPSVDVDDTSVARVPGTGSLLQQYYFNFFTISHPVSSVYSDSLSFHPISGRHQNILIAKL